VSIHVRGVSKSFGAIVAVSGVNLEVGTGDLVALLGPSGSGKTTLLRVIAGLEVPDAGRILFHGEDATDRALKERQVGFVFQHYALFRHMTVFENVAFGLRVRPAALRPSRAAIDRRVTGLLRLVQIEALAGRHPSQLSGGQRQRVALARALAVEPRILLLDEPFGALDAKVRRELRRWLRRLHDELRITTVFVTHDQEEALEVADHVVIMHEGRVEQVGTPREVYDHPANPFVYGFLGNVNVFRGSATAGRGVIGGLEFEIPGEPLAPDTPLVAFARPHDLDVTRAAPDVAGGEARTTAPRAPAAGSLGCAVVRYVRDFGVTPRLELDPQAAGEPVTVDLEGEQLRRLQPRPGDTLWILPRRLRVFAGTGGERSFSLPGTPDRVPGTPTGGDRDGRPR